MTEHHTICGSCGGTGEVESLNGTTRPCSRCRHEDFKRWCDVRSEVTLPPLPSNRRRRSDGDDAA